MEGEARLVLVTSLLATVAESAKLCLVSSSDLQKKKKYFRKLPLSWTFKIVKDMISGYKTHMQVKKTVV